jgi:hypothetical protein
MQLLNYVLHFPHFDLPGHIHPVEGLDCIVSFPGKFSEGWDKVVARGGTRLGKKKKKQVAKAKARHDGTHGAMQSGSEQLHQKQDSLLSVACVFFTQHTPKFGEHSTNPVTGRCWCHDLYGESKCWGCQVSFACCLLLILGVIADGSTSLIWLPFPSHTQWFVEWWENVKEAHYVYKQDLVVYYFPGQVGQGKIKWADAAAQALLRDKVLGNWPKDEAG